MSSLTALCITHCSYMSFYLLFLICLYLSAFMFSNFRFDPRQLYFLFINNVRALSVFSVAFNCFSAFFSLFCRLSYYIFIEHVYSPKLTVFYCFIGVIFCFCFKPDYGCLKLLQRLLLTDQPFKLLCLY